MGRSAHKSVSTLVKIASLLWFLILFSVDAKAQCPQFLDGTGVASSRPYFIGCTGGNYTMFLQPTTSIIGGYTINWGDGTANTAGANLIPPAFISHTYAAAIDTFIITINTVSPACTVTGVVVMEVTPSASIQIPMGNPVYGCTPALFNFQNSTTNVSETTHFTWNFGDGTAIQSYNYTNGGQVLSHTYMPGTTNCNVAVTLTAENYCNRGNPSTNIYQPIQVWDRDNVSITPDALIKCFPSNTFHFDNTTNLNCYALGNTQQRYEYWNFGDYWGLGHDSIIGWQPFSPPNRPGYDITYPGIGTYSVTLMDSSFCGVEQATISVQIVAPPTANLSLNTDTICEGQSITSTNLSTGTANQYIWNFGDGSGNTIVGNTASQTHTYNTAGTYTVTLTANVSGASGCTSTATQQIVVKPRPTANFTLGANDFCDSGTETFTNTSAGAISSYFWNFGNSNTSTLQNPPAQLYNAPGNYNVVLNVTGSNGCTASRTRQVRVRQSPNAQINPFSVCEDAAGTFSDASTSAAGDPIISWLWNFGDATATSNLQNTPHTYANAGTYNVTLTVSTAFCSNKDSINATVNPLPVAQYLQSVNSGCTALLVSFTNQSTGASSYVWNFGDGTANSTSTNPIHTFTNIQPYDSTYHVTMIATTALGCKDTSTTNVRVFHGAQASFTSDYVINCSPLPVQFTNTSTGATGYSWNFGDGSAISTATSPGHLFLNNSAFLQTYVTTLSVSSANGCTSSATQNITLYPKPDFSFTALPADTGCAPLSISFNASSGGAVYQWSFGDGSTSLIQSPNHTFINNSTSDSVYHVIMIATTPFTCKDTAELYVAVHPNPTASYTKTASLGCSPLTVNFTDNSVLANTRLWDFGDGTTSTAVNPTHTFVNNTSSTITYLVKQQVTTVFGCIDTMIRPVEVYPKVNATFVNPVSSCSPLNLSMTNNTTNATIYNWDFGDGTLSTQTNPTHSYVNNTTTNASYTITLIAQSSLGCTDTASASVSVFYKPDANFNLNINTGCHPLPVSYTNLSTGAANNNWSFGDGAFVNGVVNTNHTYTNTTGSAITNNAQLIVTTANACSDTMVRPITVYPEVIAGFTGEANGCSPLNISLTNQSSNANGYNWNFGDGTFSTQTNPFHTYINNTTTNSNLTISLIASSGFGCSDTMQKPLSLYYKPDANFNINTASGCHPLNISFSDLSSGATGYSWNFGDASAFDTSTNPTHVYTNYTSTPITYTATLTISTDSGCADNLTRTIVVYPQVIADFSGQMDGCSPLSINFNNQSVNTNSYNWDFDDGSVSTQTSPTHTYINNATSNDNIIISLIASSGFGCSDTVQYPINVYYKPDANFNINATSGCHPLTINFSDLSIGAANYSWNFGDASSFDSTASPTHTYTNYTSTPVTYSATLTVYTDSGCTDVLTKNIIVYPEVIAAFSGQASGCSPLTINLNNQSTNTNTYNWDFDDGSSSTQTSPTHTYINNATSNDSLIISLIASSGFGCRDTVQYPVSVFYKPNANFNSSTSAGCHPLSVNFSDQSSGAVYYAWDFGDGAIDTVANPNHIYTNTTSSSVTYTAKLIITTNNGCTDTIAKAITVYPQVIADFTGFASGCSPLTLTLNNQSTHTNTYSWNFGDGSQSSQVSVSHTYINNSLTDTTYTLLLTSSSSFGCADTQAVLVTVKYKPQAAFSNNIIAGCSPVNEIFTNQSIGASSYQWDFGDGASFDSIASPSHIYINSTSAAIANNVVLVVEANNGCKDTVTNLINVYPKVTAAFTNPVIGCSPFSASFTNQSQNANTYIWNFGNGSSSGQMNPTNIYTNTTINDQTYIVQLIANSTFGCSDTITDTITVAPQPVAGFSPSPVSQTYPSATVSVVNSTNAGNWNYTWTWGDGNSSSLQNPPDNTYASWGVYNITLIVNSANCADTVSHSITIIPPVPIATFSIPSYNGCEPVKICFDNTSEYAVTNNWDFGDGNSSNSQDPCYTYYSAGTYTVKLVVTGPGGQTDIATSTVNIYPNPKANFSATPVVVQIPNTSSQMVNLSLDADTYAWDFGDGSTSTEENPKHTYTQVGEYDVTLIATNQYGCVDTLIKEKYIEAEQLNDIVLPNAFTPNLDGGNGGVYDPSSDNNDVFFPFTINGIAEYRLSVYDRWGELLFESSDIKIGWDGYYRGKLCQQDVYVWKAEGKYIDGTPYKKFGDVTLLR